MVTELTEMNFDEFVDSNKCVLIDCWAPWCGPCRRMGPVIEELSNDLAGKVAVAKLNTDESPGISARFEINAIPTLLVFKDKILVETLVGLRPKQDILAVLMAKGLIEGKKPVQEEKHFSSQVTDDNFAEFIKSKDYALVDCWAPWCKPCMRMGPIVEGLAEMAQDRIAVGKLNVDENPAVSLQYNIQSIPTLLIYKNGKQADCIVGLSPALTPEVLRDHILSL